MEYVPSILIVVVGVAGLGTLVAGFVTVSRGEGWQAAMRPTSDGNWSASRRLVCLGAALDLAFVGLWFVVSLIPGGMAWSRKRLLAVPGG